MNDSGSPCPAESTNLGNANASTTTKLLRLGIFRNDIH